MKLNIKDSDKKILLIVLGIAIVALAYMCAYRPLVEKKDTLEVENQALSQEVEYLQTLMNDKEWYLSETERMNVEMDDIKAQFPAELYPEDEIFYASNVETKYSLVSKGLTMPISEEVNVGVAAAVDATQPEVVDDGTTTAEGEGADAQQAVETTPSASSTITLYKAPVTFDFMITYEAAKQWIKDILEDEENKKAISTLSLNYDKASGNLQGHMIVNMYSLTGTDRTYEAPNIPGIGVGTDDLFKSADRLNVATENNTYDANAEATEATDDAAKEDNE